MKKCKVWGVLIISCVIVLIIFMSGNIQNNNHARVKIDAEWEIRFGDNVYNCTEPEQQLLSNVKKGDHIELSTVLPEYPFRQAELEFTTHCSVVKVYLNRELIYTYGEQEDNKNQLVGSGRMCIALPDNPYGKNLTITLDVCEDGVFTKLSNVYIQDMKYYIQNILCDNIWLLEITLVILAIGVVLLMVTLIMVIITKYKVWSAVYLSGFAVSIATWLLCYSGIALCITDDYQLLSTVSYICLYITPIWFGLFSSEFICDKRKKKMLTIGAAIMSFFCIISWFLNQFNIIHFPGTLNCYHVLMLTNSVVCIICVCLELYNNKQRELQSILFGICLFLFCVFAEMGIYWIDKYTLILDENQKLIIPVGILLLIMGMLIACGIRFQREISTKLQIETLEKVAHTDALTQVANRLSCEECFAMYDEKKRPVIIINFDLNSFKQINDTQGHHMGDKVLIAFADILKRAFSKYAFVGRMGGDEFVVVADYAKKKELLCCIRQMQIFVNEYNNKHIIKDFELSVSYGWSDNHDRNDMSIWEVYEMADQKMYQFKTVAKNEKL